MHADAKEANIDHAKIISWKWGKNVWTSPNRIYENIDYESFDYEILDFKTPDKALIRALTMKMSSIRTSTMGNSTLRQCRQWLRSTQRLCLHS